MDFFLSLKKTKQKKTGYGPAAGGPNAQGAKPAGEAGPAFTINTANTKYF